MTEADRLRAQFEEAERLVREAQRAAEQAAEREVPPAGWSVPGSEPAPPALDWYIARLEPNEPPDADVQDIPVE